MISSEGPPLARPGAVVDLLNALPRELKARGHDVTLVLPFYRELREVVGASAETTGVAIEIPLGAKSHTAEFIEWRSPGGVQIFFVRCDEFFDREGIYGVHGTSYLDNAARFIFFNKAAIELARRMTPTPQILHCHDWAAALVPVLVHDRKLPFSNVLTIHRLADQGSFWGPDFDLTNLPQRYFTLTGVEFFGRMNLLKGGILYADRITVASEHYRREILTPEFGCGLDIVLRENAHRLRSVANGADYERWNPATDNLLPATYSPGKLAGKQVCRDALLHDMNLAPSPRGPVLGMVARLVQEKGFDVLMPALDRLLSDDVRLIIVGEGDTAFETALAVAAKKYPTRFAYRGSYDERLAHLIEAGADITLIPSRVEPGGLSAMYSLKYGALPVARWTGSIHEIIEDYDPTTDSGYGFLYYEHSTDALWDCIKRARRVFDDRTCWTELVTRAMRREFSWSKAIVGYESLYSELAPPAETAAA
jgi:starch synthase